MLFSLIRVQNAVALISSMVLWAVSASVSSREKLEGECNFSVLVQISSRADDKQLCCIFKSLIFVDTGHADIFLLFMSEISM